MSTDPTQWVLERPDFGPKQLKRASELSPGMKYKFVQGKTTQEVEIQDFPYTEDKDRTWVVCYLVVGDQTPHLIELSEMGIAANQAGLWHKTNHLLRK